jgi:glutathione S-transferase
MRVGVVHGDRSGDSAHNDGRSIHLTRPNMLTLRTSPASPFGRKVRIAAALLGLDGRIAIVAADAGDPADSLRRQNPLGKIPTLISEAGDAIFDSRVIVEYLDGLAGGGRVIPADLAARTRTLTLQALADGIADAALLQVYERRMREPAERSAKWVDYQAEKVTRALAALESKPPEVGATDVGAIALACALGYLDLRFAGEWRTGHPRLVAWLSAFAAAVPAYAATAFSG